MSTRGAHAEDPWAPKVVDQLELHSRPVNPPRPIFTRGPAPLRSRVDQPAEKKARVAESSGSEKTDSDNDENDNYSSNSGESSDSSSIFVPPASAPKAEAPKPNDPPQPAKYIELNSLEQSHEIDSSKYYNIMGTVISYTRPKRCKGKHDWMSSILIVDPSLAAGKSICLNYFGSDPALHPHFLAIGDILLCRGVKVQIYMNEPQLVGNTGFKTHFIIFHRNIDHKTGFPVNIPAAPAGAAANNPTGGAVEEWDIRKTAVTGHNLADMEAVKLLHKWTADALMRTLLGEDKLENMVSLNALYRNTMNSGDADTVAIPKDIDLTCVVVKTYERGDDLIVLVWDGSTPNRLFDGKIEIEQEAYDCLHASLHASTVYLDCIDGMSITAMQPRVLNPNTAPKNLLGCCVALTFLAAKAARHTPRLLPGTWVRFRNLSTDIGDASSLPPLVGFIKPDTYVNVLMPYCRNVTAVASRYLQRTQTGNYATAREAKQLHGREANPAASTSSRGAAARPAPVARPQFTACGKPYTPLSLCLATPAPAKFCVLGRIMDFWPKDLGKFVTKDEQLNELLPRAGIPVTSIHSGYVFAFSIVIVDDTASRSVVVFGKDAEFLLGGITPSQFKSNQHGVQEAVAQRLRDVINEGTKFDFNIRTYLTSDAAEPAPAFIPEDSPEAKRVQVFGTNIMA